MQTNVIHINPLTTIRRERLLPVPGKLIARRGQSVSPRDVIATANVEPEHLLLNISHSLGVTISQSDQLIHRNRGDYISEGDILAGPVGIAKKVVRSPVGGIIVLVADGLVMIEVDKSPFELRAGMSGKISHLIPDRGVIIEATGSLVQGVWGNNKVDFGLLNVRMENPDDEIGVDVLDASMRGTTVFGGHCKDPEVLRKGADIPISGLILASMAASLTQLAKRMYYPIIVLEGFGRIPLNSVSMKLLISHQNREISMNAQTFDRISGNRPEVIIPLPSDGKTDYPDEDVKFKKGQRVRILFTSHSTRVGTIESIKKSIVFPSGIRAPGAEVMIGTDECVVIPLVNLEILA